MISKAVAKRYARAILELAEEAGKLEEIGKQLRSVLELIQGSRDLRSAFSNPAVSPQNKKAVFEELAPKLELHPLCANAIRLLICKDRMQYLETIVEVYEEAERKERGIVVADLLSARPLNEKQKAAMKQKLAEISGGNIELRCKTSPEIIGGLRARIGDTVYDGSIAHQLSLLRRRLAEE